MVKTITKKEETKEEIKRDIKKVVSDLNTIHKRRKQLKNNLTILKKRKLIEDIKSQKRNISNFKNNKIPNIEEKIQQMKNSKIELENQLTDLRDRKNKKREKSNQFSSTNISPLRSKLHNLRNFANRDYWRRALDKNKAGLKSAQKDVSLMKSAGDHPTAIKRVNDGLRDIKYYKNQIEKDNYNYKEGYKEYQKELNDTKTKLDSNKTIKDQRFKFKKISDKIYKKPIQIREKQKEIDILKKELKYQISLKHNIERNLEYNESEINSYDKYYKKNPNSRIVKTRILLPNGSWKMSSYVSIGTSNEELDDLNSFEKKIKTTGNKLFDRLENFETSDKIKYFKKTHVTSKLLKS